MEYKVRYNYSIGVYEIMRWNNHWEQTGYAFGTRKEAEKFVDNLKPNAFVGVDWSSGEDKTAYCFASCVDGCLNVEVSPGGVRR